MRSIVLLLTVALLNIAPADAQIRFNPERLDWHFSGCSSDTTFELYLVNDGDELLSDVIDAEGSMTIIELPAGWVLGSNESINPGDSVRFLLKHAAMPGSNIDYSSAYLEFASNYFTSRAARDYPRLMVEPGVMKLADVPLRTTVSDTVVIKNPGNTARTIDLPKFDSLGWKIIAPDSIVLAPGGQANVRFEYTPRSGANVSLSYRLDDQCTNSFISLEGTTRNTNLAWQRDRLIDTIVGCGKPTLHTLAIYHTDSITPLTLDSIGFVGDPGGWTFVSEPQRNLLVQPGDTLSITVMRQATARAVNLAIFTSQAWGDTVSLSLTALVPNPQFIFVEDTVTIDLQFGETIEDMSFELKNHGAGEVRFRALEQTGDTRWTIDPIDTNLVLSRNDRMKVHTSFADASEYGIYPMTFTLVADRCDLRLSRTVIARIIDPKAVVQSAHPSPVRISWNAVSNEISIEALTGSEVVVSDLLGRIIEESTLDIPVRRINASRFPSGAYIICLRNTDGIHSQVIRIVR